MAATDSYAARVAVSRLDLEDAVLSPPARDFFASPPIISFSPYDGSGPDLNLTEPAFGDGDAAVERATGGQPAPSTGGRPERPPEPPPPPLGPQPPPVPARPQRMSQQHAQRRGPCCRWARRRRRQCEHRDATEADIRERSRIVGSQDQQHCHRHSPHLYERKHCFRILQEGAGRDCREEARPLLARDRRQSLRPRIQRVLPRPRQELCATNSRQRNAVAHLHSERDKRTYAGLNVASLFTKKKQKKHHENFALNSKIPLAVDRPAWM